MLNQLVRYAGIVPLIAELEGGRLLDVGSGSQSIAPRLGKAWQVTAVDRAFDDYGTAAGPADHAAEQVVADAADLPFADREFDVVVSLDMLEHVPPAAREGVLGELARVTARRLIVACPAGAAALIADRALAEHCARRGLPQPGWLQEHLDHGFPEPEAMEAALAPFGTVRLLGNESAAAHRLLMRVEAGPRSGVAAERLSRVLSVAGRESGRRGAIARAIVAIIRGLDRPPTYRSIAVLDRGA